MILSELLGVVVQQLLDVGLDEPDLGKDLVGRGGPDEGFCVAVPVGDVVLDPLDETLTELNVPRNQSGPQLTCGVSVLVAGV